MANSAGFLKQVEFSGFLTNAFVVSVYLTYSALYMMPIFIPLFLLDRILNTRSAGNLAGQKTRRRIILALAIFGTSLLQVLIYADRFIHDMYGFHINGFVWNLVWTRGGLESLGGSESTTLTFTLIILGIILFQAALMAIVVAVPRMTAFLERHCVKRRLVMAAVCFIVATAFERITYGVSIIRGYRPVLAASTSFPLYLPTRLTGIARIFGVEAVRTKSAGLEHLAVNSAYPQNPIQRDKSVKPLNIVWLACESLRWDMVDAEIMPATYKLAQKGIWCRHHYSGGNGTRMGMFSMFYGLYGCFWFPIFEQQRSPVIMDVLHDAGYQMQMFTSASFTYPEFDRTIFVSVPAEKLHEAQTILPWKRDAENVTDLLEFIEKRDPSKPFMTFMFFESPHARYHFPVESVIRKPYLEDMNYATMDLKHDVQQIKNRYINACHYTDSQFARVIDYLEQHKLLDSTILIITGDHGEEFMEKGHWGHNNDFTEEQTRPAMVMWVPGGGHKELTRITSHLDIPPTVMKRLGVTNPERDYSLGYDLLGDAARDFTVICDWNHVTYVDSDYKVVLPFNVFGFAEQRVTRSDDQPVTDLAQFEVNETKRMTRLMDDIKAFSK